MKRALIFVAALPLAACGPTGGPAPTLSERPAPPVPVPVIGPAVGGPVVGATAPALVARFGQPQLDLTEGTGRKLQFSSGICVLDAYLYPPRERSEPVVTHVDTRQRDGGPIDPASCVATLGKR